VYVIFCGRKFKLKVSVCLCIEWIDANELNMLLTRREREREKGEEKKGGQKERRGVDGIDFACAQ